MEYTVDNIKIADARYKYKIDFGTVYGKGGRSLSNNKGCIKLIYSYWEQILLVAASVQNCGDL